MIKVVCSTCKKDFFKQPSAIKRRGVTGLFCSKTCYYAFPKPSWLKEKLSESGKGIIKTEKWKKNLSIANLGKKAPWNVVKNKSLKMRQAVSKKNWKGGRVIHNGYVHIFKPDHPNASLARKSYIKEHRLVMEKHLGRFLEPHEVIHHINGIKTDNRIENLMLFSSQSNHIKFHESNK